MATTACSGVLGRQMADPGHVTSGTVLRAATPDQDGKVQQQQLRVLQWATPVLTGALIVLRPAG